MCVKETFKWSTNFFFFFLIKCANFEVYNFACLPESVILNLLILMLACVLSGEGLTHLTCHSQQVHHEEERQWQGRVRLPFEMADRQHADPGGSYSGVHHSGQSPGLQGQSGLQADWAPGHCDHLAVHRLHSHALPVGLDLQADQHH